MRTRGVLRTVRQADAGPVPHVQGRDREGGDCAGRRRIRRKRVICDTKRMQLERRPFPVRQGPPPKLHPGREIKSPAAMMHKQRGIPGGSYSIAPFLLNRKFIRAYMYYFIISLHTYIVSLIYAAKAPKPGSQKRKKCSTYLTEELHFRDKYSTA